MAIYCYHLFLGFRMPGMSLHSTVREEHPLRQEFLEHGTEVKLSEGRDRSARAGGDLIRICSLIIAGRLVIIPAYIDYVEP